MFKKLSKSAPALVLLSAVQSTARLTPNNSFKPNPQHGGT